MVNCSNRLLGLRNIFCIQRFFSTRHDKKQRAREESEKDGGKKETEV
jgi:hypothetical protein